MTALKNPRQEAFAQGIAKGMTADAAYAAAGYTPNSGNATRLKRNESIVLRVAGLVGAGAERAEIGVARVLTELARVGLSDVRRLFDASGGLRAIAALDDDTAAAVSSVEVVTRRLPSANGDPAAIEYVHKIKFWDKNSALEKIGKHLGMYVDRHEHTGRDGGPMQIEDVSARAILADRIARLSARSGSGDDPVGAD